MIGMTGGLLIKSLVIAGGCGSGSDGFHGRLFVQQMYEKIING